MKHQRPFLRVKARKAQNHARTTFGLGLLLAVATATVLFLVLIASSAQAQYPRLGVSASPDEFIDNLDVTLDEEFQLYVCVFGIDDETPLEQDFSSLSWVLHQVCCGAVLTVTNVEYSPDFQHEGSPVFGVVSTPAACVSGPIIRLATLTMAISATDSGGYLAACGPYEHALDCDGENVLIMGLSMVLNLAGSSTPTEDSSWDHIKAIYR